MIDLMVARVYLMVWGLTALTVRTVYARRAHRRKAQAGSPKTNPHPLVVISMALWVGVLSLFVVTPEVITDSRLRLAAPLVWPFQLFGLIGLSVGIWLLARAHQALGEFYGVQLFIKEAHRVIDAGPYAYIRHPMYTAYLLWILSSGALLTHAGIGLIFMLAIAGFHRMAKREEQMLGAALGAPYEAYLKRTGMFLPKWSY